MKDTAWHKMLIYLNVFKTDEPIFIKDLFEYMQLYCTPWTTQSYLRRLVESKFLHRKQIGVYFLSMVIPMDLKTKLPSLGHVYV